MRTTTLCLGLALGCALAGTAAAKDIYVSVATGTNENPGTKEAPKKLLWKVFAELAAGDHVYVAEGRYSGQSKSSRMPKCAVSKVVLEGGWKADFSERNPFRYLTIIGAPTDVAGDSGKVFHWESPDNKIDDVTIDGFCIDRGEVNIYYADGEPGANKRIEGHKDSTPWGYRAINRKMSGSDPVIELLGQGKFAVKNCILVNCPWWGIYVKAGGPGPVVIENNFILSSQGRGIEAINGSGWGATEFIIRNNTVLFSTTLKSTEGRALSIDPREAKYLLENNVLACSDEAGYTTKFQDKNLTLKNNRFFFNRGGDAGSGGSAKANAGDFEDELTCTASGNVHELPKALSKLAREWIDRWSSAEEPVRLAGTYVKDEELMAVRGAVGLKEFVIPGYDKTYASYKELPQSRNNYSMSRYPHPMKSGETMDWATAVLPAVGADAPMGIMPFEGKPVLVAAEGGAGPVAPPAPVEPPAPVTPTAPTTGAN